MSILVLPMLVACTAKTETTPPETSTSTSPTDTDVPADPDEDGDGVTVGQGDCDDDDADVHPGAPETCDGIDEDCDGTIDEDAPGDTFFYADTDGDGYGDAGQPTQACTAPSEHVADATDCDDGDRDIHPGATDLCGDGVDHNCDGADNGVTFEDATGGVTDVTPTFASGLPAAAATWTFPGDGTLRVCAGDWYVHVDGTGGDFTLWGEPGASLLGDGTSPVVVLTDSTVSIATLRIAQGAGGLVLQGVEGALVDVTLEDNVAVDGAGLWAAQSTLDMLDVYARDNVATEKGGGMYFEASDVDAVGIQPFYNSAGEGGGIYAEGGDLDLDAAVISDNTATDGGGLAIRGGVLRFNNAAVRNSRATQRGGGMFVVDGVVQRGPFTGMDIEWSTAIDGGGLYAERTDFDNPEIRITDSLAAGRGGAAFLTDITGVIDGYFRLNSAGTLGGGLYLEDTTGLTCNCTVTSCDAAEGGGLYVDNSRLYVPYAYPYIYLSSNVADVGGGARIVDSWAFFDAALWQQNSATTGGALSATSSVIDLGNSGIEFNSAGYGAGVHADASSEVYGTNTSLTNNNATVEGGAVWTGASIVQLDDATWFLNAPDDLHQALDGPYSFPSSPTLVDVSCDGVTCTW